MNPSSSPVVALADTRWMGHHPTYLTEMSASLLRCGARVILLCREPETIAGNLRKMGFGEPDDRLASATLICREESFFSSSLEHDPLTALARWRKTGRLLHRLEKRTGWRADLVFFPFLDNYLRFAPFPFLPERFLGRPWSGLYFRLHHLSQPLPRPHRVAKGDFLLKNSLCRAVCVLDERFNDKIAAISGRPVLDFPDITNETPADCPTPLSRAILEKAGGRKIIGLISMEKRKGLLTFLKAALAARKLGEPWFFATAGPFCEETFTSQELEFCRDVARRAASGEIDNLHFEARGERIQDGPPYNSVFTTFDLVWAAYENFEGSSNALTKAAAFRIPVVATAGECIGSRVEKYHLGTTFKEGDADQCLSAIRGALAGKTPDGGNLAFDFESYHARHSRERLDAIFRELLDRGA